MSITGFDDIELARFATPSLTTATVPQAELGRQAWAHLRSLLGGEVLDPTPPLIAPVLAVRASSGSGAARRAARAPCGVGPRRTRGAGAHGTRAGPRDLGAYLLTGVSSGATVPLARYESGEPGAGRARPAPLPAPRALRGRHRAHRDQPRRPPPPLRRLDGGPRGQRHLVLGRPHVPARRGPDAAAQPRPAGQRGHAAGRRRRRARRRHRVARRARPPAAAARTAGCTRLPLADGRGWTLRWSSVLHADHGPLRIESPGTNGRPSAGYGGIFWRLPSADVTTVLGDGPGRRGGRARQPVAVARVRAAPGGRDDHRPAGAAAGDSCAPGSRGSPSTSAPGPRSRGTAVVDVPAGGRLDVGLAAVVVDRALGADEAGRARRAGVGMTPRPSTAVGRHRGLPTVAVVGVHGHGASHVRRVADLQERGLATLAAVVDPRPVDGGRALVPRPRRAAGAGAGRTSSSSRRPIHTHLPLASAALRAGCDVLLEKPTTASLAEHAELVGGGRADRAAVPGRVPDVRLGCGRRARADRRLPASWGRSSGSARSARGCGRAAYYARAPWAGRRTLDGVEVVDGVVTNPLAHAVATALLVAGARTVRRRGRRAASTCSRRTRSRPTTRPRWSSRPAPGVRVVRRPDPVRAPTARPRASRSAARWARRPCSTRPTRSRCARRAARVGSGAAASTC